MDSDGLHTFLTIHRAGSFSLAAEKLGRSQPAISRRIALLEEEVGAPLFERAASGIVLSQVGRVLLPHAERVMAALKDSADALDTLRNGDGGPVALAAVGTLAGTGLSKVLKRFAQVCPKAELTLRTATSTEVSELVRSGEATVGLRYFEDFSPDLLCEALQPEKLVVACTPTHGLAGRRVKSLCDLRAERWLAFPDIPGRREFAAGNIFTQFLMRGVAEIDWMAVDSLTAQKRLVEAGFGISLMPESSLVEERKAKSLALITVNDLKAVNPVMAITRKDGYLSAASQKLLRMLGAGTYGGEAEMTKGYWIVRVDVSSDEGYKPYAAANVGILKKFEGKYLVRGGPFECPEGAARARNVVIEFPDYATALACYNSPEYQANKKIRQPHGVGDVLIIGGYDGPQP